MQHHSPSSQTSVSMLTASALLCRCCSSIVAAADAWPLPAPPVVDDIVCCFVVAQFCSRLCFSVALPPPPPPVLIWWCAPKNGASRTCEPPSRPGCESTPSSRSIMSDDDSDSEDFFRCWPALRVLVWLRKNCVNTVWVQWVNTWIQTISACMCDCTHAHTHTLTYYIYACKHYTTETERFWFFLGGAGERRRSDMH